MGRVRVALTLLGTVPAWIAAQGDAPDLLPEVSQDRHAPALARAEAFVLLGVTRFYEGQDSAAAQAFRAGLDLDPQANPPAIIATDSALDVLWLKQRVWAAGPSSPPDTLFYCVPRCVGLDSAPAELPRFGSFKILVEANGAMNQYGIVPERAMAVLRLTVDTIAVVERGSVELVSSTLPREMLESLVTDSEEAGYRPGRVHGRPVRVRIQFEVTMHGPQGR